MAAIGDATTWPLLGGQQSSRTSESLTDSAANDALIENRRAGGLRCDWPQPFPKMSVYGKVTSLLVTTPSLKETSITLRHSSKTGKSCSGARRAVLAIGELRRSRPAEI